MTTESSYDALKDNRELVADLTKCENHLDSILLALKSCDSTEIQKLLSKSEALNEGIEKIFVKLKEEWKLVLGKAGTFMKVCLEILKLNNSVNGILDMICEFLRSLTLCILPKRLARYWPTEVDWLTKLVQWIELFFERPIVDQKWTTLYVLILWLSSAVKTPFDLSRFDSNNTQTRFVIRIGAIISRTSTNYLLISVFHILAGSFYSRHDILNDPSHEFDRFIKSLLDGLSPPSADVNEQLCRFRTIATLLKSVDPVFLKPYLERIFFTVSPLVVSVHELETKLCIKILGRLALAQIKPKLLKYRYDCGKRVIDFDRLKAHSEVETDKLVSFDNKDDEDDQDDGLELPEYFENLIQILIENIHNPAGQPIHYSVAKYLASICWRLPQEFSDEILNHICDNLCQPYQDSNAWHGACLTLAEFIRRGYVPIEFMPKIVEIIKRGLIFEEIKGSFSLGSFVRDATSYICWSLARGYDGKLIGDFVDELAPVLINSVCFDKDLNCRRAASAVIQELAGRTQRFPNWIDVISRTDFNSLSRIERTYLELGFHFGTNYPEFQQSIIEHLCNHKIVHCDPDIRRLAARTLGHLASNLSFEQMEYCLNPLKLMLGNDMNSRHGSILMLSYLILNNEQFQRSPEVVNQVVHLVSSLSQKNLFIGIGGDFMREACLILIKICCEIKLEHENTDFLTSWSEMLLNTVQFCQTEFVKQPLIEAINGFLEYSPKTFRIQFNANLIGLLSNFNNHSQISLICKSLIRIENEQLLDIEFLNMLVQFFKTTFHLELRESQTIGDSIEAIIRLCDRFHSNLDPSMCETIKDCWKMAFDDHTINKTKGDVGLFVRKSAIQAITVDDNSFFATLNEKRILYIIQCLVTEALTLQRMTLMLATKKLSQIAERLLRISQLIIDEKYLNILERLHSKSEQNHDIDSSEIIFTELLRLFPHNEMASSIWLGCVPTLAQPSMKKFHKLIFNSVKDHSKDQDVGRFIKDQFLNLLSSHGKDKRLILSCLEAAKMVLIHLQTDVPFQREIAQITWENCQTVRNVKNYIAACDIFCLLIPLSGSSILRKSFAYIYVLLGNKIPRIRSYTANELYSAILSLDDDGDTENIDIIEKIGTIIQETDWLKDEDSNNARNELRTLIRQFCDRCQENKCE